MVSIFIVDDDKEICNMIRHVLEQDGWELYTFQSAEKTLAKMDDVRPDIVVADYKMPGMNGMELLREIQRRDPEVEFMMITGHGDKQNALRAMEMGAFDYIKKPLNFDELRMVVNRAVERRQGEDNLSYIYDQDQRWFGYGNLIGSSSKMRKVFNTIRMVGDSKETPVVIVGETGTGKEVVARSIHDGSGRKHENFVEINCAAIPTNLLESELFGYEEGAFTDARRPKRGLLEIADGGTFFLDELAGMGMELQVKLLKAIEEKNIRRVGGIKDIPVDMRILASSRVPMEQLIQEGRLRKDLYYRLNVITINLPPLRERGDDILLLARHFIKRFNNDLNLEVTGLTEDAQAMLMSHDWPGNVRELRNVIERAVLLKKYGKIDSHHLMLTPSALDHEMTYFGTEDYVHIPEHGIDFEMLERNYLVTALRRARGNKSKAAELLGMNRGAYRYRLDKYFDEDDLDEVIRESGTPEE